MTWVIGIPGLLNGGAAIADIRITIADRSGARAALGGVLKLHQVGRWMVMGFAGNVNRGFLAVEDLRAFLDAPEEYVIRPGYMTWHWARRLRYLDERAPAQLRCGGCELLIIGASPRLEQPFPITHGYILRGPQFVVETIPMRRARSIGSGSAVES